MVICKVEHFPICLLDMWTFIFFESLFISCFYFSWICYPFFLFVLRMCVCVCVSICTEQEKEKGQ